MKEWIVDANDTEEMADGKFAVIRELVRCKGCEFYNEDEKWCRRLGLCGAFDGNGFCSHGERREDVGKSNNNDN